MITRYNFLMSWLKAQAKTERGASLVEYALLVALIAVACIAAIGALAGSAGDTFSDVSSELDAAG